VPRIPVYEARVGTAPLSPPSALAPAPTGIAQLGAGIAQAGTAIGRMVEEERQKAEAVQITNLETGLEQDWTELFHDDKAGLRSKVGESAFTTGEDAKTLAEMQKRAQARLKAVPSERARGVAALRLQGWMASREREVEGFVSQQRRAAELSAVEARKVAGLDAAARSYADPKALEESIVPVETSIRALSPSKEAADVEVSQYRAVVVGSAIDAALARRYGDVPAPDVTAARGVLEANREALGPAAAGKLQAKIDGAGRDTEAAGLAGQYLELATDDETGQVNEAQALAPVEEIADVALRDEVRTRTKALVGLANAQWKKRQEGQLSAANTILLENGDNINAVPSGLKSWLVKNYPEGWRSLVGKIERASGVRSQNAAIRAEAKRAQGDSNAEALTEFRLMGMQERAEANVEALFGLRADPKTVAAIAKEQQTARTGMSSGLAADEDDFVRFVQSRGQGLVPKESADELTAEARQAFNRLAIKLQRKPTRAEIVEEADSLLVADWVNAGDKAKRVPRYQAAAEARRNEIKAQVPAKRAEAEMRTDSTGTARPAGAATPPAPSRPANPAKLDRARALRAEGKSNAEIAAALTAEGY
jgi:hypothetical protein